MAESKYSDGYSSDQEEKQLVLGEEDDGDGDFGSGHHHTLNLACSIAVKSEVLCVAFSYDGRYLLACCGDGLARVFNPVTGVVISVLSPKRARSSSSRGEGEAKGGEGVGDTARGRSSKNRSASILDNMELPCTCAAFRPHAKIREKTSGVALIGNSHGEIQLWHVPSAKLLYRRGLLDEGAHSHSREEGKGDDPGEDLHPRVSAPFGVEVLCCAYSGDGQLFAVGASDGVVRVYSDSTKELVVELKPGLAKGAGHSSRIFSVKFHPDDPNVIVSGGWDNCVHVWDVGKASTTRTVFGPHICGNALDVVGDMIVTGSWRDDCQLETWDLDSGDALGSPFWSGLGEGVLLQQGLGRKCRLYAASFGGPDGFKGKFIAAGGGEGANEVKVFDVSNNKTLVGSLLGLSAGAISLAFGPKGDRLAVGLADGKIHLMDIEASAGSAQGSVGGLNIMGF